MNLANTEQINEVLALVKSRREEIKNSPSVYPVGKNTYFVDSLCGSDKNDGSLGEMENIDAAGNITLNGGFGWSHQRPDPTYADWLMWGKTPAMCHFENCGVHDNVILNSKRYIMHSASIGQSKVRFYNNTVIHGGKLGLLPETLEPATLPLKSFEISDENLALLEEKGVWENNKFYKLKSEQSGVDGFNPPIDL